jgi:hypothetical protein
MNPEFHRFDIRGTLQFDASASGDIDVSIDDFSAKSFFDAHISEFGSVPGVHARCAEPEVIAPSGQKFVLQLSEGIKLRV